MLYHRAVPLLALFAVSSWCGVARAQAQASFPINEEDGGEPAPESPPQDLPQPVAPADATPPATPPSAPPDESPTNPPNRAPAPPEANPYGEPPPSASSMPGNPYGTVTRPPPAPAASPGVVLPQPPPVEQPPEPSPNWSIGGGIGIQGIEGIPSLGSLAYGYPGRNRLVSSLIFERRLSDSLHLLFQPVLFYQSSQSNYPTGTEEGSLKELSMSLEGGLRWVANPGKPVEVGMSHLIFVGYNQLVSDSAPNVYLPGIGDADLDEVAIGLSNSLIAERELVDRLWLRMGVGLLGVNYYSARVIEFIETDDGGEEERESDSQGLRLGFTPSFNLQLRLAF